MLYVFAAIPISHVPSSFEGECVVSCVSDTDQAASDMDLWLPQKTFAGFVLPIFQSGVPDR